MCKILVIHVPSKVLMLIIIPLYSKGYMYVMMGICSKCNKHMCKGHKSLLVIILFIYIVKNILSIHIKGVQLGRLRYFPKNLISFIKTCTHNDKTKIITFSTRIVVDRDTSDGSQKNKQKKKYRKKFKRRSRRSNTIFPTSPYCAWDQYTTQEEVWRGSIPTLGTDYTKTLTQHGFEQMISESGINPISKFDIPLPGVIRNRDAALRAQSLLPPSKLKTFYVAPDDVKQRLLDPTYQGYYSTLNNRNFHQFYPEFYYKLIDGEIKKNKWEYPSVPDPPNRPVLERDKVTPSVPLGWRNFCVLAIHMKGSEFELCHARQFNDLPQGRLASGLFCAGEGIKFIHTREVIDEDGHLIHSELPIEVDERFDGTCGDLVDIDYNYSPPSYGNPRLSNRFSESEPCWPRKSLETMITTLSPAQIAWARLSTTLLNSTAKILKLYRIQLEVPEIQESSPSDYETSEKEVIKSISVGVMYNLCAPTYHHALQFVSTDPFAKSRLYSQMHLFEQSDFTDSHFLLGKQPTDQSFRQYLIFAQRRNDSKKDNLQSLRESTLRFLVRSNCVQSYRALYKPFLDKSNDLNKQFLQLLPITDEQKELLSNTNNVPTKIDKSAIDDQQNTDINEMYMINGMNIREAYDWANRLPMCRAGHYESLFVSRVDEIGFYPQNAVLTAPVPTLPSLIPMSPEYVRVSVDPINKFIKRYMQIGTALTPPKQISRKQDTVLDIRKDKKVNRKFVKLTGDPPNNYTSEVLSAEPPVFCRFSPKFIKKVLYEYAPEQLDRPFYLEYLNQFYFMQLPKGRYFSYPKPFSGANQAGTSAYQMTSFSASDMCHKPEYRPQAIPGLWINKSSVGTLYHNVKNGIVQWFTDKIDPVKLFIISGLVEDETKKGKYLQHDSFYPPFMRSPRALRTNVSNYDVLYGLYGLWNRGIEYYASHRADNLPPALSCFSYIDERDRLLQKHPDVAYDIQLDFLERYEQGLVGMEDEPLNIMSRIKDPKPHKTNLPQMIFKVWDDEATEKKLWPDDDLPLYLYQ